MALRKKNLMKRTLAITALAALTLTACANADEQTAGTITPQHAPETTTTSETTNEQPETGTIGTPVNIATLPDNEVNMTVTDIQLGGECKYGALGVSWLDGGGTTNPGMQLLQISVDVENIKLDNPETQNDFIWLEEPQIVDSDGYTSDADVETACELPTDNHQDWTTDIHVGEKKRLYRAWGVPENTTQVKFYDMIFEVE